MKNDIFKFEKDLILTSLLKVINEGLMKTQALPSVAYYSGLTEHTVRNIFPSVEFMLNDLAESVSQSINTKIRAALKEKAPTKFKDKFMLAWTSLFGYYQKNPQVITFIEQSNNLGVSDKVILAGLISFFYGNRGALSENLSPELCAYLFNGHAMSAAKIASIDTLSPEESRILRTMGKVLWQGMKTQKLLQSSVHQTANLF